MSAVQPLVPALAALALLAVFLLLFWAIARGARRMLGNDAAVNEAIARCASCAERPLCETGALAGWLSIRPRACPNLEILHKRQPL
jgi:hypothetical protein